MQKKQLVQWLVGITGACLCLFVFSPTAFAQSTVAVGKAVGQVVVTDTVITDTLNDEPGLLIVRVEPASPAAKAGLVRGDIVLKIDDKPVNKLEEVKALMNGVKAGDSVTVTVQHGDVTRDLSVTVGERKGRPFLGIVPFVAGPDATMMTPGLPVLSDAPAARLEMTPTLRMRVIEVVKDSPAEKGGLQAGDAIVGLNGKPVSPESGLAGQIQALAPGDVITLEVQQGDQALKVERTVTLGKNPDHPAQAFLGVKVAAVKIMLFKKQLDGSMPGNRFNYTFPAPYPGWWMPMPYYGMPPLLMMPYGGWFGQPVPGMDGGDNEQDFFLSIPGTPAEGQNFFYRLPPPAPMPPTSEPVQIELSEDAVL